MLLISSDNEILKSSVKKTSVPSTLNNKSFYIFSRIYLEVYFVRSHYSDSLLKNFLRLLIFSNLEFYYLGWI